MPEKVHLTAGVSGDTGSFERAGDLRPRRLKAPFFVNGEKRLNEWH